MGWGARASGAEAEPPERSEPAQRRASDGAGEFEGRRPSNEEAHAYFIVHGRRRNDVLRELPARQRAGRRAAPPRARRGAHAGLHADEDRREERQRRARVLRRHQRLPGTAFRVLPAHAALRGPAVGLVVGPEARHAPADQGRCAQPRRDDRVDAERGERLPGQGDREAARLAPPRGAVRRHQPAVLAAARAGRAAETGAADADLLHAAGG